MVIYHLHIKGGKIMFDDIKSQEAKSDIVFPYSPTNGLELEPNLEYTLYPGKTFEMQYPSTFIVKEKKELLEGFQNNCQEAINQSLFELQPVFELLNPIKFVGFFTPLLLKVSTHIAVKDRLKRLKESIDNVSFVSNSDLKNGVISVNILPARSSFSGYYVQKQKDGILKIINSKDTIIKIMKSNNKIPENTMPKDIGPEVTIISDSTENGRKLKIDGNDSDYLLYTYKSSDISYIASRACLSIYTIKDGLLYEINLTTSIDNVPKLKSIGQKMISSFKFKHPHPETKSIGEGEMMNIKSGLSNFRRIGPWEIK